MRPDVSPATTEVLLALMRVHQRDGRATVRAVAREACRSVSTTHHHLTFLSDLGLGRRGADASRCSPPVGAEGRVKARVYLVFVGLQTRTVRAFNAPDACDQVRADYEANRGFKLRKSEVRARRAKRSDIGWLTDAGERTLAAELERTLP